MLILDTHILIDFVRDKLSPKELRLIEKHQDELAISDIVLWEIAKLKSKKRIEIDFESPKFKKVLRYLKALPITVEIADLSVSLDFSSDPADELIAATSMIHHASLLTRDETILKSKLVSFAR